MQSISTNYLERIKQNLVQKMPAQDFSKQEELQIDGIGNVTPDYNVKVPAAYQKIKDIELPFDLKASLYKLSNGQNVIIVPKEGSTVVKTYVKTGSMNEPDNLRGISHYIEHNLFNGSDGLDAGEFFERVNDMGAGTNASTGFAETNYYIASNLLRKQDLEDKIKLHASMLQYPHFDFDKLEKEKGIVNSEINMILSDPENIGFQKCIKNLYNINSASLDLIGGTTENITNLTREDVVNYFNKNYYPANMTTVITGEVDPDKTMQLVSKYFNLQKNPPQSRIFEEMKPLKNAKREDIISDKAYAAGIYTGFNGPVNSDIKGKIEIQALENILSGSKNARISKELRPYNTDVFMTCEKVSTKPGDGTAIIFNAQTTEENSAKVMQTIADKINELQSNPPSEDEMNSMKKALKKHFEWRFEHSGSINELLGSAALDGVMNYINEYENIVDGLTPEDITNAAKKYLDTSKASLVVIHPNSVDEKTVKQNHPSSNIVFTGNSVNTDNTKKAINMNNVNAYKLQNNFQVVTNDIKTNNCVLLFNLKAQLPANVNPATPLILYKMLNAGSAYRSENEFLNDLEQDAIYMEFNAGNCSIEAETEFNTEDTEKTLKALKEVVFNPRFTEENFNIAKSNIEENIKKSKKSPLDKLNKELFPNDNYGAAKEEILEGLKTVTMADVRGLYEYIIQNPAGTAVMSAPFSKKPEVRNILFNELGMIKPLREFKPQTLDNYVPVEETKVLTDTHNDYQADIVEAFKFKNNGNLKDDVTIMLLNTILGESSSSRLFNDLREKQKLAYSVQSKINYHENSSTLKLFIGTTTENKDTGEISYDNVQKAIDGFNKHIQKIKTEKVTDKELENAKLCLKNSILEDNETSFDKTLSLACGLTDYYGVSKYNQIMALIDDITADDILNAANYIFNTKPVYSINATQNTLDANKEYFESLVK